MEHIKDLFYFTKTERYGVAVLIVIIVVCFTLPKWYATFFITETKADFTEFKAAIAKFEASKTPLPERKEYNNYGNNYSKKGYKKYNKKSKYTKRPAQYFAFNPNTATASDFVKLGLSERQGQMIEKYRSKGGVFYKKKDFAKVYGLSTEDYERLEPYIAINESSKSNKRKNIKLFYFDPNTATIADFVRLGLQEKTAKTIDKFRQTGATFWKKEDFKKLRVITTQDYERLADYIRIENPKKRKKNFSKDQADVDKDFDDKPKYEKKRYDKSFVVNINTGTMEDFQKLKGIGATYASRIVKFRDALGGFVRKEQIKEVYGFPDSTYQALKAQLDVGTVSIQKININEATEEDLKRHPYLKWKQAKAIVTYREQHGDFASIDAIQKIHLIGEKLYKKLKPYLSI